MDCTLHRGAFCQFPFRRIYYYSSNKSTGKEIGKTHLCALYWKKPIVFSWIGNFDSPYSSLVTWFSIGIPFLPIVLPLY